MEETTLHNMLARPTPTLSHMRERGSPPTRVTFVDLPQHVRNQIYREAGYGGNKFIDLNLWTINRSSRSWLYNYNNEWFSAALLSAGSHLIHDEVETKLYAENTFAVSLIGDSGLQPLERLSDTALRELRTLIVSICPCLCRSWRDLRIHHTDTEFFKEPSQDLPCFWNSIDDRLSPDTPHSRPLTANAGQTDNSILSQWKQICARLAANSRPHQLSLSLVANVADIKTAKCILDPLSGMPPLRDVAINLGRRLKGIKDFDSRSFIRDAAKGLLGENVDKSPFRFMSLPLELQIQILQQTSLVAGGRVNIRRNQASRICEFKKTCYMKRVYPKDGEGRLSQPMASATSILTPSVSIASVIVSRQTYTLKIATDGGGGYRLTLPPFLRRIPLESLWSLRNLCVIFPTRSPDYLLPNQPDWHAWVESIQRLSLLADLSRLRLEVHFGDLYSVPSVSGLLFDFYSENQNNMIINHTSAWGRRDESMKTKKAILNTYKRILEPLKKLDCKLLSLQVYLSWSLLDIGHEERKGYERSLEKMIMGDEYDSAKSGERARSEFV